MLIIQGKEIRFDTMKNNAGVFSGNNVTPLWNAHFKSNLNVTSISIAKHSNGTFNSINVINDNDGLDFTASTSDFVVGQTFETEENGFFNGQAP